MKKDNSIQIYNLKICYRIVNIVSHFSKVEVNDGLYIPSSSNPPRCLLRTNSNGATTFKVDNTLSAMIDSNDTISQTLGPNKIFLFL